MAVKYTGLKPERNYTISDFYEKGIVVTRVLKFKQYQTNNPMLRVFFRSNGLLGEIRSCYHGKWAVDARWGWWSSQDTCLTTECNTVREAKSILFEWFRSKGYTVPEKELSTDWSKSYLRYNNQQLSLNPFIFR